MYSASTTRFLDCGWTFTQIGGGQGTEDGEWLETSTFPTSIHVELLHSKKIPDPVSTQVVNDNTTECTHS
jgi:beta-mannosidase